jgi:ribosomal protein S18 acetylase RimI-like enzyme|tara:strand:+ start:271 stop:663 length:393 start_codon:yes stop_codon:yes gene_type:complete
MELKECTKEYWEFIRILRNDKRVLDGFINSTHITKEMQESYMQDHSQFYRVALYREQPCGYIGVIEDDIRICTHPDFQGQGIGKFMLKEIMKIFPTAYGKVKIDNKASKKLFSSVGFKEKFIIYKYDNKD